MMKSIELFAGIGGIALAAKWAGIETSAFCERDEFCQKVLNKHWPNIPIFDDVCAVNKQSLEERGVDVGAIRLISGGFPCQPFSIAGHKKGTDDDRDLWPEMFRIIREIRPDWVVGENVAHFANMELDRTIFNLESIGYQGRAFIIPAASVGAIHRRDRVFVVAHANGQYVQGSIEKKIQREPTLQREFPYGSHKDWTRRSNQFEPKLCRSLNGFPNGVDRLRSLGNAVVPQQIYPIFKSIMELEEEE